jgi:tetratricopeptide (TPR) repeat protein
MAERIGMLFSGRYRLDAELGQGGMGVVYRAHDTLLERDVALKVLNKAGLGSEGRARLLHEAQAAAQLHHPNVVAVYDAGEAEGLPFIVMELVGGHSLAEQPPQSLDELLAIADQVCAALDHAHAHNIVHRDLKPENIIVTPEGQAKLTDFGLARSVASRLTAEGTLVGTVFYLAPESAMGAPLDGRADLYALGVLLYEFAAGRLPFTADEPVAVISQHLYAPVVPPSTYNAAIPPALDALIVRLMAKRPDERPASAAEVRQALRAVAAGAVSAAGPDLSPLDRLVRGRLVGREREFAEAKSWWLHAVAGGEERVLLISGEAGVGKTPLVRGIKALAEVTRARVLESECYSEGSAAYAPIAQLIRDALILPRADLPPPILADLLALAPDLRAHHPDITANPSLDPQAERQRLFESVVALCTALAGSEPLLLVVEDIQWADAGSLFLLRHLARRSRAGRLPILLILTYREAELDQTCCLQDVLLDLNRERLAMRIKLARYDREQTRALLEVMFQQDVPARFVEAIYRETEGNMFFVEEVCRALVEEGKIYREAGRWHLPAGVAEVQIPQSVRLAIQARVAKLPETAQEVLRLAAILGREFDFATLHRASEMGEEALIAALEAAEAAQLIEEVQRAGQELFVFAHALTQAALRESVAGLRRRRLHRRAAAAIEALRPDDFAALAYHYEQAGDAALALGYYQRAGDRALAVYANQEAIRFYRAALDLGGQDAGRAGLLAGLGESLFRESQFAEAVQNWREAIALYQPMGDLDTVARLYARAARATWHAGDAPGSLVLAREALALMPADSETPGMATLLHETGRAYFFNGQPDEALPLCQQALALAERLGLVEVQADTLATLGLLPNQTNEARRAALLQAVELAEAAGLLYTAARAHVNLGGRLVDWGELAAGREHFQRARELGHRVGLAFWEYSMLDSVADVSSLLGDLAAAEETIPLMQELGEKGAVPADWSLWPDLAKSRVLHYRGEWEESLRLAQAGRDRARQMGDEGMRARFERNLAETLYEAGRFDEAEALLTEVLASPPTTSGEKNLQAQCLLSWVYSATGRAAAARQQIEWVQAQVGDQLGSADQGLLYWSAARAAAAEGNWAEALSILEQVVQGTEQMGMRWYHARLQQDMAGLYIARGEPGDLARSQELLKEALTSYRELQCPGYVAIVEERLHTIEG